MLHFWLKSLQLQNEHKQKMFQPESKQIEMMIKNNNYYNEASEKKANMIY